MVGRSDETSDAEAGSREAEAAVRGFRFNDARNPITVLEGAGHKTAVAVQRQRSGVDGVRGPLERGRFRQCERVSYCRAVTD